MKNRAMILSLLLGFQLLLLRPCLGEVTLEVVATQKATVNAELQAALNDPSAFERLFNEWATAFGKTYASPAERAARAAVFRANLPRMVQLNSNPAYTFWMEPAFYTDVTDEEFIATHYGADNYPRRVAGFPPSPPAPVPAPALGPGPTLAVPLPTSAPVLPSTPTPLLVNPPTATPTNPTPSSPTPTSSTLSSPIPTSPTPTSPTPTSPTPSSPTPTSPTPSSPTPSSPTPTSPTPTSPTPTSPGSPTTPPPASPSPPTPGSSPLYLPLPGSSPQPNPLGMQSTSSSIASGLSLGGGAQQSTASLSSSWTTTGGFTSGLEAAGGVGGLSSGSSSSLVGSGGGSLLDIAGGAGGSLASVGGGAGGFSFGGRKLAQSIAGNAGSQASQAPTGACTDVAPDKRYSCEQQKGWGKCNASWMLAGNWCQQTCNRCTQGAAPAPLGSPPPSPAPTLPPASPLPPAFNVPPSPMPPRSPLPPAFNVPPSPMPPRTLAPPDPVPSGVPDYFSWVEQGKVTPVKDQGNCSSCWAFAAAAALESMNAIQRGPLLNVSVQDIIDCSPVTPGYPPRAGCGPGMSTEAMKLTSTSGVTTPSVYGDYTASYGTCKADVVSTAPSGEVLRIPTAPGYVDVTPRSAVDFMRAVALRPITVLLWAPALLRDVRGGIFNAPCPDSPAANDDVRATYSTTYGPGENHEVAVVGYNARAGLGSNTSYITIKNSWGEGVGNGGYFNLRLDPDGSNGLCGIYLFPLLPEPLTK